MAEPTRDFTPIPKTPVPFHVLDGVRPAEASAFAETQLAASLYEPLRLLAMGNDYQQIGQALGIRDIDVKNRLGMMQTVLGVGSNRDALIKLVSEGKIDLGSVLPENFDPDIFTKIQDPNNRNIIQSVLMGADYQQISVALKMSIHEIQSRVDHIKFLVGAKNNFQIFVIGLGVMDDRIQEAKASGIPEPVINIFEPSRAPQAAEVVDRNLTDEQLEILKMYMKGLKEGDISEVIQTSLSHVRRQLRGISNKLNTPESSFAAIKAAVDAKIVQLKDLVPEDFDPGVFEELDPQELSIVKGLASSLKNISQSLGLSEGQYRAKIKQIRAKTGAKRNAHLITLYLRAKEIESKG